MRVSECGSARALFLLFVMVGLGMPGGVRAEESSAKRCFLQARDAFEAKKYGEARQGLACARRELGETNARIESLRLKVAAARGDERGLIASMERLEEMLPDGRSYAFVEKVRPKYRSAKKRVATERALFEKGRVADPGGGGGKSRAREAIEGYRAYLKAYPKGYYAAKARGRIEALEARIETLRKQSLARNAFGRLDSSWQEVQGRQPSSWDAKTARREHRGFLKYHPKSKYAGEVRRRLEVIEDVYRKAQGREWTKRAEDASEQAQEFRRKAGGRTLGGVGLTALGLGVGFGAAAFWATNPLGEEGRSVTPLLGGVGLGLGIVLIAIPARNNFEESGTYRRSARMFEKKAAKYRRKARSYR